VGILFGDWSWTMGLLTHVALAFVPIFVAIDAAGCVPVFLSLTAGLDEECRRRTVNKAATVSLIIALAFAAAGPLIFRLLGIEAADFQIGGGLLLFGYAVVDILATGRCVQSEEGTVAIVPLATPLLAGPALLTTVTLMADQHGLYATVAALSLNMVLTWAALRSAHRLAAAVGREALGGVSKVLMVLLAGIGVMMVRKGLEFYLG
jgi:multiple antibiotic resistance protein